MKIMKSNFIKKIIIILVIIMVLNTLLPDPVNAGILATIADYAGGILMKPLFQLISATLMSVDIGISVILNAGTTIDDNPIDYTLDSFLGGFDDILGKSDDFLQKLLVGPDTIFEGKVDVLNANIFRSGMTGTMANVRNAVARIYYLLRNICGFIMLGGLIFTGIRILLSSNIPTKKSQYLNLLQDWLIGMVLLVFSHVLMTGIFYISDAITDALGQSLISFGGLNFQLMTGLTATEWKITTQFIYSLLLTYTIWLTVVFAVAYFKRFLWVCVLVVFAPVFAVMYSFGQQTKQIYSKWIREFCMTVFVQPFHMIVYSVLIGVPMGVVKNWKETGLFDVFYALLAMTMIRPAEKYMRQLFGMDKGIANMASYDSGKKTITDGAKAVAAIAATVFGAGGVVKAVSTASKAAKLAGAAGSGSAGNGVVSALGSKGAAGDLGEAGETLSKAGDALDKLDGGKGNDSPQWIKEDWDRDDQGRYFNPYNEEWYTENELNSGRDLPAYMDQDDFDSKDIQALTSGITDGMKNQTESNKTSNADMKSLTTGLSDEIEVKTEGIEAKEEYVGPAEFMKTLRENSEAKDENMTDNDVAKAVGSENVGKMLEDAGFSKEEIDSYLGTGKENGEKPSEEINASNVTINAGTVNMEGATLGSAQGEQIGATLENVQSDQIEADNVENQNESSQTEDDGISLEGGEDSKPSFWQTFKNIGGLEKVGTLANDLIDGHNTLTEGLYVDGTAPTGEWHANSQWRRQNIAESKKEREEKIAKRADNWANNKANISIMSGKYIEEEREKAQKKYGKSKDPDYIESVAQEQAQTKAKAALKDMSVYVQYGVTDVNKAYDLYKNANDNGFKPEESIRNMAGFNKFNTNAGNVNNINVSNNYTGNNYTSVEQAIPDAKTYYDAGYTDVKDMAWVDYMAQKLNKTPDYAIAVDEALKKKGGKLTYNGSDENMKKVIGQINSHYGG